METQGYGWKQWLPSSLHTLWCHWEIAVAEGTGRDPASKEGGYF
jgi:hypothetical protein